MIKSNRWIGGFLLFFFFVFFFDLGATNAQSSTNYKIKRYVINQGGAPSQSANYKIIESIGQPSPIGILNSTNFRIMAGFFVNGGAVLIPILDVSPTTLDFGATQPSLTFQISNTGDGSLTWNVAENPDKPWITSISPTSGTGNATVTVTVDRNQLTGTSDTGTLLVSSNAGNQNVAVTISRQAPPIIPVSPQQTVPESEFWVNIDIGSSGIPVSDLKVVSFELLYTNTSIVDYQTHEVGDFITGAQATVIPDDLNGKISVSVYRTTGGNSGFGTVIKLQFKILNSAVQGQKIDWSFSGVQANNSTGGVITLAPQISSTEITGLLVWPGDADNGGVVNIFDINSIVAIHWGKTGPVRPNASIQWVGQPCPPWAPPDATYTDCNGSGIVDIFDINSVIINFGKTHSSSLQKSLSLGKTGAVVDPPIFLDARDYDEVAQEFWMDVTVGDASLPITDLKVVSFELTFTNTANVDYDSYQIGGFLPGAQATVIPDDANGKVSASVYLLSGGQSGHGIVISLKFKAATNHTIDFDFSGIQANSSNGSTILLTPAAKTVVTSVAELVDIKPKNFTLFPNYPNPFNPETTISYSIPKAGNVLLQIFDLNGRLVTTLVANDLQEAGVYSVNWNARDQFNKVVSSGIYISKLTVGDKVLHNKLIFSK